jgi:YesN/AraC family two-component response regulator
MYKLAMIDDEDVALLNLSRSFDWEAMGFRLAGLFSSGEEFLEFLRNEPVDIILSDIKMPKMDGIEMVRAAREICPDALVALLSGYRDFEYARRAISSGVFSYILKPVKYSAITEEFAKIRAELDRRRAAGFGDAMPWKESLQ